MPDQKEVVQSWKRLLAPFSKPENRKAWWQLTTTAVVFGVIWVVMLWSLNVSYLITVLLAFPAAGFMVRMFIFQHDCGHGSFFTSRTLNTIVGRLIGVMTLMPFDYWKHTHGIHHAHSGNLDHRFYGEVKMLTVREYQRLGGLGRLKYRIYRSPIGLLVIGPVYQFIGKHRLPLDALRSWKDAWRSVWWTNAILLVIITIAWYTIGLKSFFLVQAPITFISGAVGIWLFYVQHQFEGTYWERDPDWDFYSAGFEGSSFYDLPKWAHWFTGNIGYHHVHHLASRIPNYNLARCYHRVDKLQQAPRLGFRASLKCVNLKLWDEKEKRLVSFRQARQHYQ